MQQYPLVTMIAPIVIKDRCCRAVADNGGPLPMRIMATSSWWWLLWPALAGLGIMMAGHQPCLADAKCGC